MESLSELANRFGSDKGTVGPSEEWPAHNYADVYEAYLSGLRKQPINFLEIGLGVPGDSWQANIAHGRNEGGGASIKTWYEYFSAANIVGADINPADHLDNDRVSTYILDQGDAAQLDAFADQVGVQFDVIIDDGSHRPDHQQVTISRMFSHLKPGGVYFIEDLMANGQGDGDRGRFTASDVLNTRRLFKHFMADGEFPEPNALTDPADLAGQIESVTFHVPAIQVTVDLALRVGARQASGSRPRTEFIPHSEAMCAVRKKV